MRELQSWTHDELVGAVQELETEIENSERLTDYQGEIYRAIVERGYRKGWSACEFLGRQIVKLYEEIGELAYTILDPNHCDLAREIEMLTEQARIVFDNQDKKYWRDATNKIGRKDIPHIRSELADTQVVLFCAAQGAGQMIGKEFNLLFWAWHKARDDIERGVRDEPK